MAFNFSFVIPGKLAGSGRPGRNGSLADDLARLVRHKIAAVVSLTEEALNQQQLERFKLRSLHLPIQDFTAPRPEQMQRFVCFVDECLSEKLPVLVHCGAGIGRTGTMLACYLVHTGITPREAIATVRRLRPGSIETHEQEKSVHACVRLQKDVKADGGNESER